MGLLVKRITEANTELIVVRLAKMVTSGKQHQEREISSLGLKAVVADLPSGRGAQNVAKKLTPTLITALNSKVSSCSAMTFTPNGETIGLKPGGCEAISASTSAPGTIHEGCEASQAYKGLCSRRRRQ